MKAESIAALIQVRSFLHSSIENISVKLSREEVKQMQAKITELDKTIIKAASMLDVSHFNDQVIAKEVRSREVVSSEDTETVLVRELAKTKVKATK